MICVNKSFKTQALPGIAALVIEDYAPCAKLFSVLLRDAGARVRVAASAEEALRILGELTPELAPELIVLDLVLPRMGGLDLAQQLRENPRTKNAAIVAVSSSNAGDTERRATLAGCDGYLKKPVDTDTFAGTLATYLKGTP